MSNAGQRLREWVRPRKWSVAFGLAPVLLATIVFEVVTGNWVAVSSGLLALCIGASLVAIFIVNPTLWEPENRWRFLALWIGVGTLAIAAIVAAIFLLT